MRSTVLICDPDVIVRSTLSKYLRDCGYLVIEAAGTEETVTILSSERTVCCILANVEEGASFNGFHLAQWVREYQPGTKVLLAGSVNGAAHRAVDLCRDHHDTIERPLDPQLVVDRIRRMLSARDRAAKTLNFEG